jgi:UDP-N-acetylmuramoyl-tripeptide--D-alanyl-D-alanine ligase
MRFYARDVAEATGGQLVGNDCAIDGVSFDSRSLLAGQLFAPIIAERDGHEFIPGALERGAAAYLTDRNPIGATAIIVADTAQALLDLARWGRQRLSATVIGVTGSVGKTSTKDLAKAALAAGLRTAANERSFNNDQGLPVTILNAPNDTEALVVEMGMRGFGEIDRLCKVAEPSIGVVTKIAAAHTERVGSIEGVARAKGELVQALPTNGYAVLNGDDPLVSGLSRLARCRVLTFGTDESADMRIANLTLDHLARARFTLETPWGHTSVELAVSGAHMALNAAAALGVAGLCGVDLGAAAHALGTAQLSPWRMEVGHSASGATIINDAYNANPSSMRAAIQALLAIPVAGRRIAVLGVMAELADPQQDHHDIASLLSDNNVELFAVGTDRYGIKPSTDIEAAIGLLTSDDAVLIKGSRVAGLERVAALLIAQ